MKALKLLFMIFLLAGIAAAQAPSNPPDAPGLIVTKKSWRREVRNPVLEEDPLLDDQDQSDLERARKEAIPKSANRAKANQELLSIPASSTHRDPPGRLAVEYLYNATFSNTGTKTITKLVWEYLLTDPKTRSRVGHHRFTNVANIHPGKSANLFGRSTFPPASVVDARKAGDESTGQYTEQIVIYRIEYKDGPAWERPSN
jgi:hypothetical protein